MSGTAVVFDAYRREQYEGTLVSRVGTGITIELENGVRLFATNDRIVTVTGETKDEYDEDGVAK